MKPLAELCLFVVEAVIGEKGQIFEVDRIHSA